MAEMTLKQAWEYGNNSLETAGVEEATLDSWYLLEWATGVSKARYFMDPSRSLSDEESQKYLDGIASCANSNCAFGHYLLLLHVTFRCDALSIDRMECIAGCSIGAGVWLVDHFLCIFSSYQSLYTNEN